MDHGFEYIAHIPCPDCADIDIEIDVPMHISNVYDDDNGAWIDASFEIDVNGWLDHAAWHRETSTYNF